MAMDYAQANFRIPIDLKAALERSAQKNHRSLTAEIVARLEQSFPTLQPEFDFEGMGTPPSSPSQAPNVPGWMFSKNASPDDIQRYAIEALRQGIDALNVLQNRQEIEGRAHLRDNDRDNENR